ncbi:MAG: hypothetical protein WAX77_01155 [Methylococcaceae bacterium]
MNNASIETINDNKGINNSKHGNITLNLDALIPSFNQLLLNGKAVAGSEENPYSTNIIQAVGNVTLNTPQLNINSILSDLNYTMLAVPDLNKNDCQDNRAKYSYLKRKGKGGLALTENKAVFIAPVSTEFLKTITPIETKHNDNLPCTELTY